MNSPNPQSGVPISYPATFYDFLVKQGLAADEIYSYVGIDTALFDDPNNKITVEQYIALTKQGLIASNNPGLGLIFGSSLSLQSHNYLGFAMQSCNNGHEANRLMCQYINTRFPSLKLQYQYEGEYSVLIIEDWLDEPELHLYNLEVALATIYKGSMSLQLLNRIQTSNFNGNDLSLHGNIVAIELEYPKPKHFQIYQDIFPLVKISFNKPSCRILLNKAALEKPFSFANPSSLKLAESMCLAELKALSANESLTSKIHNLLISEPLQFPNLDNMAKQLNLSSRALSRSLKEEGTSYQEILDSVRKQLSIHYLKTTQLSIAEIAYRLNFEQPTNFTRAFKKWTQKSPSDYRT